MNIQQAKEEITHTLQAYLAKDALGSYRIPSIRQRPLLLMGPPGIGKTQIMSQIASETGVGLVAYTITHHTRQSAVGLPFIEHRSYSGRETAVTEYTMSEILASVYELMEHTGIREGILFLDEINCVSETLAPMMLQFLQCKTFGNQALPEGWIIVAAGNPPEYNKSVRDFDVVTLDRVRRLDISADFAVWKPYARRKNIHGAILSYLELRPEDFYQMETSVDGPQFATARGWEDLSELMTVYEALDIPVTKEVIGEYIQLPRITREFASYLSLYDKYRRTCHVPEILAGKWESVLVSELRAAPFDERLSVLGLLLSRLSTAAGGVREQDELTETLYEDLKTLKTSLTTNGAETGAILKDMIADRQAALTRMKEAGQLDPDTRDLKLQEIQTLEQYQASLTPAMDPQSAMEQLRTQFNKEIDKRKTLSSQTSTWFDNAFRFLEEVFGQGQELVMFVTELTAGYDTSWFVENFGCDAYYRHNRELLFDDTRRQIRQDIADAR